MDGCMALDEAGAWLLARPKIDEEAHGTLEEEQSGEVSTHM